VPQAVHWPRSPPCPPGRSSRGEYGEQRVTTALTPPCSLPTSGDLRACHRTAASLYPNRLTIYRNPPGAVHNSGSGMGARPKVGRAQVMSGPKNGGRPMGPSPRLVTPIWSPEGRRHPQQRNDNALKNGLQEPGRFTVHPVTHPFRPPPPQNP
jgi:hypothetical protein